jgi:diadenosine tetraphosphate (Ap4A) HIT family hydrolase
MTTLPFSLHPQLRRDFRVLGRAGRAWLLLRHNAALPWFLLVPETACTELFELPADLRQELVARADVLAAFAKNYFKADKINTAAIGNIVSQLHLHVIARRREDCCWPQAAWGHVDIEEAWRDAELSDLEAALRALPGLALDVTVTPP